MIKKYLARTILLLFSVAVTGFAVLLVLAGGPKEISLLQPPVTQKTQSNQLQKTNLTATAAEAIASTVNSTTQAEGGQSGQSRSALADQALAQTIKAFQPEHYFPDVQNSELNISPDLSTQGGQAYISELLTILKNTGGVISVDATDPALLDFETPLRAYDRVLSELYALPVPMPLLEIHRQAVGIASAQHTILTILKDHSADPLQAFLAAQSEELVITRIEALQGSILNYLAGKPV